jgi:hypothetical protein
LDLTERIYQEAKFGQILRGWANKIFNLWNRIQKNRQDWINYVGRTELHRISKQSVDYRKIGTRSTGRRKDPTEEKNMPRVPDHRVSMWGLRL